MLPVSAPKVECAAPKVEARLVELSDFKMLPVSAPEPAPKVECAAPKVECEAPKVEDVEKLEDVAMATVVLRTVFVSEKTGLRTKMSQIPHDQHTMKFKCPAFEFTEVSGKFVRASIPRTLGKRTSAIREKVIQRLGYVPPGAYMRFSWEFKRDAAGKLLEEEGDVEVLFQW